MASDRSVSLDHEQFLSFGMEVRSTSHCLFHTHLNGDATVVVEAKNTEPACTVGVVEPFAGL
jgi:hypothetical protein